MSKPTARIASLLAALALLVGACVGLAGGDEPLAEMSLERVGDGQVDVVRDGEVREVSEAGDLRPGDLIVTGEETQARLRLVGERNIWIAPSSQVSVVTESAVEARSGSVLVVAAEPTAVNVGDVKALSSNGVFRVDRRVATARAASYQGTTGLTAPGDPRVEIPPLFQAAIAAGALAEPRPYQLSVDDVWDAQWLRSVVALDDELRRLASSFSNQLTKARPRLAYFRKVADVPVGFMRPYLRRSPAEVFIAYTVAEHAPGLSLADAFEDAFALRDDGGSWGVTAAILKVEPKLLVNHVEELFLDIVVVKKGKKSPYSQPPRRSRSANRDGPSDRPSPEPSSPGNEPKQPKDPKEPKDADDPKQECSEGIDCVIKELPLPDNPPEECEQGQDCLVQELLQRVDLRLVSA